VYEFSVLSLGMYTTECRCKLASYFGHQVSDSVRDLLFQSSTFLLACNVRMVVVVVPMCTSRGTLWSPGLWKHMSWHVNALHSCSHLFWRHINSTLDIKTCCSLVYVIRYVIGYIY